MFYYLAFALLTAILYTCFGNFSAIKEYYHVEQVEFRQNLPQMQKRLNEDKKYIAQYNYLRLKAQFHDGKLFAADYALLINLLKLNPHHKGVLNLLAVNEFKHKNFSGAIIYWQKIIALLDLNTHQGQETKLLLEKMIDNAKFELNNSI